MSGMVQLILNEAHLELVVAHALETSRHSLVISTADVKDLHVPRARGQGADSLLDLLARRAGEGLAVRILHSAIPSRPVREKIQQAGPGRLILRRCIRVHAKALIADGRWMYLGSANLTGAGLGAKSPRRRNFEAGICTDQLGLIDPVGDMIEEIWAGRRCGSCDRRAHCPEALEEARL